MHLNNTYFLKSVGNRAVHYAPGRNHLNPCLQVPRADLYRLLLFTNPESAQRYAARINLGPSFFKVTVAPGALIRRQPATRLPQLSRPSFYLEVPQDDADQEEVVSS